jgi:anti-sigma B factor antagonist
MTTGFSRWEIAIEDDGRELVVTPRGELDLSTAPEVEAALQQCTDGHDLIVCDLAHVDFIDSSGIRMLVQARDREPERFAIAEPSPPVKSLLELTGLQRIFRRVPGR